MPKNVDSIIIPGYIQLSQNSISEYSYNVLINQVYCLWELQLKITE